MTDLHPVAMPPLDTVVCMDALDFLHSIPEGAIDLIVTSPPYDNLRTYNGYSFDFESIAQQSYRVLKQGGALVWVVGDSVVNGSETLTSFKQALYFVECGFRMHDTMIWRKVIPGSMGKRYNHAFEFMFILSKDEPKTWNPQMTRSPNPGRRRHKDQRTPNGYKVELGYRYEKEFTLYENVWDIQSGNTGDECSGHPAVFPEKLAERHILTWSNPGDVVLDYFGGSGTTAKMARNNGRHYLTCDISEEYCELMRRRLDMPYTMRMFE